MEHDHASGTIGNMYDPWIGPVMKKYEQIDISGDVGLTIFGSSPEELFCNAALGLFSLITDISTIPDSGVKDVFLSSDSLDDLLVNWLNELIFLVDTDNFIGKSFSVRLSNTRLEASISGGTFDPQVNESRLLIKAATYHGLSLKKVNKLWEATVIFDI